MNLEWYDFLQKLIKVLADEAKRPSVRRFLQGSLMQTVAHDADTPTGFWLRQSLPRTYRDPTLRPDLLASLGGVLARLEQVMRRRMKRALKEDDTLSTTFSEVSLAELRLFVTGLLDAPNTRLGDNGVGRCFKGSGDVQTPLKPGRRLFTFCKRIRRKEMQVLPCSQPSHPGIFELPRSPFCRQSFRPSCFPHITPCLPHTCTAGLSTAFPRGIAFAARHRQAAVQSVLRDNDVYSDYTSRLVARGLGRELLHRLSTAP